MRLFSDESTRIHNPFMRRAYELALRGAGATSPNPMVGCVITRNGELISEGFHERAGGPHAEAVALSKAGARAEGSTMYVTLEPCNHHGRTPPCSEAILEHRVAAVVIGMADPNPLAEGGAKRLREAGLSVEFESDPSPYESLNEEWLFFLRTGRPFVRVKVALSLDGHPTSQEGVRCKVSGEGGARITMRLRERSDAVLVGASTARIDNPSLTVRGSDGIERKRQPLRVVIGRDGVPAVALFSDKKGDSLALVPHSALDTVPPNVSALGYDAVGGLDAAVRALGDRGVRSLLVEAGPRLLTALWEADLVDELVVVHAGGMFGPAAPAAFLGIQEAEKERLLCRMRPVETGIEGHDAVTVWRRAGDAEGVECIEMVSAREVEADVHWSD